MLRDEFLSLITNTSSLVGVDVEPDYTKRSEEQKYLWHLVHCFGYMRQIVVCNMDMTLEWPTGRGLINGTISGYEIPHQCVKRVSRCCASSLSRRPSLCLFSTLLSQAFST